MTTTATHTFVGPIAGNGTTPIPFSFQGLSASEIGVIKDNVIITTGFTVTLNADGTGSVIPITSWTGSTIYIYSKPSYQQQTNFGRFDKWYPDQMVAPLDKLQRQILALKTSVAMGGLLPNVVRAGKFLSFDAGGNPIPVDGIGGADTTLRTDLAAGNGALIAIKQAGTGAITRTLKDKLDQFVMAEDFGATGDGVTVEHAALQTALNTGKPVLLQRDKTYLIGSGLEHVAGSGFVCLDGWAIIKAKTGGGGFNITSMASPRDGLDRNMLRCNGTDNLILHNIRFTTDGVTPVALHGVRMAGGMATEGYDLRVAFSGFFVGQMITGSSLGAGKKRNIHIVSATDSGTSLGNATFTTGAQTTVIEIDNDIIASTPSQPGNIQIDLIRNILYSGQALIDFGQETDGVNIIGQGANSTSRWNISIGVADGIGELIDIQGWKNKVRIGTSKNTFNDAIKLIHGAQHNDIEVGVIEASGRSAINISGSATAPTERDTKGNKIKIGTIVNPGSYGLGLTLPSGDVTAVLFSNAGSTYKPINNVIEIGSVIGDGINLDHVVKDGGAGANNENIVIIGKASGFVLASVSAPNTNVRVQYLGRSYTEMTMSAAPSIATGVVTLLPFNTVVYDLEGIAVTGSNKFAFKWPGIYEIKLQIRMDSVAVGANDQWQLELKQGASTFKQAKGKINFGAKDETALLTAHIHIRENDIGGVAGDLYAYFAQDTGASKTISNAPTFSFFSVARIG